MPVAFADPEPVIDDARVLVVTSRPSPPGSTSSSPGHEPVPSDRSPTPAPGAAREPAPWVWRPLSGSALLSRLRNTGRRRPVVDPELVAGVRSLLGEAAGPVDGPPVVLTGDRLGDLLACPVHAPGRSRRSGPPEPGPALACGALVAAAFRQLAVTGAVDDPMEDGLAALEVDDFQAPLAAWIRDLPGPEARELRAEVVRQVDGLRRRWPPLAPSWMPRVGLPLRVPVAAGAVLLSGRVDLSVGRPAGHEASVALLEVVAGARRPAHRDQRSWLALLETLRSGVPPFAVATYFARTGELDTDPVDTALLAAAAHRAARGIAALTGGSVPELVPAARDCPECLRDGLSTLAGVTRPGGDRGAR